MRAAAVAIAGIHLLITRRARALDTCHLKRLGIYTMINAGPFASANARPSLPDHHRRDT